MSVNAGQNYSLNGAAQSCRSALTGQIAAGVNTSLTAAMSGSLLPMVAATAAVSILLPPNSIAGMNFTLYLTTANAAHAYTVTAATANTIIGGIPCLNGVVAHAGVTSFTFTTTALTGDNVTLVSDGTYWLLSGCGNAAASFT